VARTPARARRLESHRKKGSLVVVGTGIKLVAQTTLEAVEQMKRADRLFYLADEPATEVWLRRLNATATSLSSHYAEGKPRELTYAQMAECLVAAVRSGLDVCAAFYGHPGVFVDPSHDAIRRLRRQGYRAQMLPGVSTEDCLFADLGIDPGERGCQSFEATDFLVRRRRFDPTSGLVLWQVGRLGEPSVRDNMFCRPERLEVLTSVLRRHYPPTHRVVLYAAAQFPICKPTIRRVALSRLPKTTVWPVYTIYVPPLPDRADDVRITRWFDEA
jgi:uncharacterized protein YabN with tetrapyrrole methylase and pyrophosphatase domain